MRSLKTLIALFLVFALSACNTPAPSTASSTADVGPVLREITVVLDWTPNTNHTGLYVAQDLGFYEEAGLKVNLVQPPESGALALLAANQAHFAISFQEEIASAISSSSPLPVLAVASIIEHNLSGLITLKEKNVTSPKDLEGLRYASWDTPLEHAIIDSLIEADGGDPTQLNYVPNTVLDVISALQTDTDAVWIFYAWDGIAAEVNELEFNYMEFREYNDVFDFYTPVIATSERVLEQDSEVLTAFLNATKQGYEYAMQNPREAAAILLKAAPELNEDVVIASQIFLAEHYSETEDWGQIDADRWNNFYNWLFEQGLTSENLSGKGFSNEGWK